MLASKVLVAVFAFGLASASAVQEDWTLTLLKRQAPGTPLYACHEACGTAITASRSSSPCTNTTFVANYNACLACADPTIQNIWIYYGTTLTTAGKTCGFSTTPIAASAAVSSSSFSVSASVVAPTTSSTQNSAAATSATTSVATSAATRSSAATAASSSTSVSSVRATTAAVTTTSAAHTSSASTTAKVNGTTTSTTPTQYTGAANAAYSQAAGSFGLVALAAFYFAV